MFDPSKPFTVVEEEEDQFDPSKPFTVVDQGPAYGPEEPPPEPEPEAKLGLIPSLNALDGFEQSIDSNDRAIEKIIGRLGELDQKKYVYSPDHYEKEKGRLGFLLKSGWEERNKNAEKLNSILKDVIPTDDELKSITEKAEAWNADEANRRNLKTPQDFGLEDPNLSSKLFDREGDGFDDIRKDREAASNIYNAYLEEARKNPNPRAYEIVTKLPGGGIASAINSFSKKSSAKHLEQSPPKGLHKDKNLWWGGDHLDYEGALADMAAWTAAMEAEHGKKWFERGGWKAFDAAMEGRVADVQKQGRLAGMGFLGQKTWDIITMAPGYAA